MDDKPTILIADSNQYNRSMLASMLSDNYDIIETSDGAEAVGFMQQCHEKIQLVLLGLNLESMNGIDVLITVNKRGWLHDTAVIIISYNDPSFLIDKAFDLGAEDFINPPCDKETLIHRIQNAIKIHQRQNRLIDAVSEEFFTRERQNNLMIGLLSHIVEQRNGESGAHVMHINTITGILLEALNKITNKYGFNEADVATIKSAASFHDIGKIAIPYEILNKPGKLTTEEFAVMKTHSEIGADMMKHFGSYDTEPLIKYSYEICRWHHERYDGRGYPDGLVGDDIPIAAQVVSVADVYDALTSERCYKAAYSHEQAIQMITNGECGVFNPLLIKCLYSVSDILKYSLSNDTSMSFGTSAARVVNDWCANTGFDVSNNVKILRESQKRQEIIMQYTSEMWFEIFTDPLMIVLNKNAEKTLHLPEQIVDPVKNRKLKSLLNSDEFNVIARILEKISQKTKYMSSKFEFSLHMKSGRILHVIGQNVCSDDVTEMGTVTGAIGRMYFE